MLMQTNPVRWLLLVVMLLTLALAMPADAFFGHDIARPLGKETRQRGEWVRSEADPRYDKTCTPSGCVRWCVATNGGLMATNLWCQADPAGNCIPGTTFVAEG